VKVRFHELISIFYNLIKSVFIDDEAKEAHKSDDSYTYAKMILRDKRRWAAADVDGDGLLSKEEFISFLHPEESVHMKDIVVYETMDDMDKDKDDKISMDEYIGNFFLYKFTTKLKLVPMTGILNKYLSFASCYTLEMVLNCTIS